MRAQPLGAVLTLSIDLPPLGNATTTTEQIRKQLAEAEIRATWFSDNPARDSTIGQIQSEDRGDETGLRIFPIERESLKSEMVRAPLMTEVSRLKADAQQAGISITSLAISGAATLPAERLVKLGITASRSLADAESERNGDAGFAAMRFGIWRVTPDLVFRGGSGIGAWRNRLRVSRAINRCIRNRQPLYLAIDAATLSSDSAATKFGNLARIVRHISRLRQARMLEVCTIAETVSRLAAPQSTRSAGSILRAA